MEFLSVKFVSGVIFGILGWFFIHKRQVISRLIFTITRIIFPPPSITSAVSQVNDPPVKYTGIQKHQLLQKLKREEIRLKTFQSWTNYVQEPQILAKAGFFYFNVDDLVQCAFCLGVVGRWQEGDDPFVEHRHHFHDCPFILGFPVGNIRLVKPTKITFGQVITLFRDWILQYLQPCREYYYRIDWRLRKTIHDLLVRRFGLGF